MDNSVDPLRPSPTGNMSALFTSSKGLASSFCKIEFLRLCQKLNPLITSAATLIAMPMFARVFGPFGLSGCIGMSSMEVTKPHAFNR